MLGLIQQKKKLKKCYLELKKYMVKIKIYLIDFGKRVNFLMVKYQWPLLKWVKNQYKQMKRCLDLHQKQ